MVTQGFFAFLIVLGFSTAYAGDPDLDVVLGPDSGRAVSSVSGTTTVAPSEDVNQGAADDDSADTAVAEEVSRDLNSYEATIDQRKMTSR